MVIERSDDLLIQFVASPSRRILVDLATSRIENVQSQNWRDKCVHCEKFGWDYLDIILTVTNWIISNKVKNFNSKVAYRSSDKIRDRKKNIYIFISISHLDIMKCTILTNFNMQIALIVVIFHSFDTIIITIILII